MHRPLEGLIVVELARLLPAPLVGMVLRDLGATVFKIEFLPRGDSLRGSLLFDLLNRGKYSLAIPPTELSALLAKLLPRAQVLLTNYRPATQRELGLLPEVLLKAYPHLVYVNLLGFSDGRPGHDLNFLAESGVLERLRPSPAHPPIVPGFLFGDILGGSASALIRLLASLYHQARTGQGGYLPITMREEILRWSLATAHLYQLSGGQLPPPGADFLSGGMPAYRVYATADGRYIAVAALEEKFWEEFCQFLGRPDLIPYGRTLHDPYPHQEIEKIFAAASWAEWVERLKDTAFCVTPVYTFAEAIQAPWAQEIWQKGFLCFTPPGEELHVPALGEHNAYLTRWLE